MAKLDHVTPHARTAFKAIGAVVAIAVLLSVAAAVFAVRTVVRGEAVVLQHRTSE